MLKSILNKTLKAALSELFTNAEQQGGINLSMGNDLFSNSNMNLKNLKLRPDIFDIILQPIHLVSGSLGSFILEGIAELPFGGKLKIHLDEIFLLFEIDTEIDAERAQILKKILLELTSSNSNIPQLLLREILKRIQGYPINTKDKKDQEGKDVIKKRKLLIRAISYAFQNISIYAKNIHIRFEVMTNSKSCSAIGFTLPSCKIVPLKSLTTSIESSILSIPQLSIFLKSFQLYCDYDILSYASNKNQDMIVEEFKKNFNQSHTGMILPMDIELRFTIEIRKLTGLCSFKVEGNISNLKFTFDYKQLQVLQAIIEGFVIYQKKAENNLRVKGIFGRRWLPPRIREVGGITILPHLFFHETIYPKSGHIPRLVSSSLVRILKERLGPNWGKAIWRYVIRLVIADMKKLKPFNRWIELIKLVWIRKQYSFIYSRLLKRSKDTGNMIIDVNCKVDVTLALKLFDYEMYLTIPTIRIFRSLAIMVSFVELMNSKKKQGLSSNNGSNIGSGYSYEKTNINWYDILRIHSEIFEVSLVLII